MMCDFYGTELFGLQAYPAQLLKFSATLETLHPFQNVNCACTSIFKLSYLRPVITLIL
jgi:hypothetical protein